MSYFLTDSHAHIHSKPLKHIAGELIERAAENNIKRITTIGTDLADSAEAASMAEKYKDVYAAVGVHPHYAAEFNYKQLGAFEELASKPDVIAVGEVGLDFYRNISPKDVQIDTFSMMIDLASGCNLPIIIHSREAAADTVKTLENMLGNTDHPVLFHCFSGEDSLVEWGMKRKNVLFSFAGNVTYPKAVQLHAALGKLPADRLLIETDCPYLAPIPFRGRQNEPSLMVHTAKFVSAAKNMTVENLASQLESNFTSFFRI